MTYDYAIVGAGIFGLALARQLAGEGNSVILFDAGAIGGAATNASAGLLGALMPANPLVTGPLAEVQLRCLAHYQKHIDALEQESGLPTGYRRHGRLQPILTGQAREQFIRQQDACTESWRDFQTEDHLRVIDRTELEGLYPQLAPQLIEAPFGYAVDRVSAQVTPRLLLAALAKSVAGKITLQPQTRVLRITGGQIFTDAATYTAKQTIITAGWQTGALAPSVPIVGVKGQACALAPVLTAAPLVYTRNGYIVFHETFTALGSTVEKHWTDTQAEAEACAQLQQKAAALMPAVQDRDMIECWAGVRPKATGALPLVMQADAQTIIVGGGYKIGLALGFEMAGWLAMALRENRVASFWTMVAREENFRSPAMLNMTAA